MPVIDISKLPDIIQHNISAIAELDSAKTYLIVIDDSTKAKVLQQLGIEAKNVYELYGIKLLFLPESLCKNVYELEGEISDDSRTSIE